MAYISGKAKILRVVSCDKHGNESDKWRGRMVVVGVPKGKNQRKNAGCPVCARERRVEAGKA